MSKKILVISDMHFSQDNELLFGQYDAEQSFALLFQDMKAEQPDYVLILGDISNDGSVESYQKIKNYLLQLPGQKYAIMGNHDSFNISNILCHSILMTDYLDIENHRFIFLSSYKGNGCDDGYLKNSEIKKLQDLFDRNKSNYLVIHHHFIKSNGLIDDYILENHKEFCQTIAELPVKAIFHGHVHNSYCANLGDIHIHAAPSTCVQIELSKELNLLPLVGYQTITLTENNYIQFVHEKIIPGNK